MLINLLAAARSERCRVCHLYSVTTDVESLSYPDFLKTVGGEGPQSTVVCARIVRPVMIGNYCRQLFVGLHLCGALYVRPATEEDVPSHLHRLGRTCPC